MDLEAEHRFSVLETDAKHLRHKLDDMEAKVTKAGQDLAAMVEAIGWLKAGFWKIGVGIIMAALLGGFLERLILSEARPRMYSDSISTVDASDGHVFK